MPLSISTAVIATLGIAAPEGSVTAPLMFPEAPTPCACAVLAAKNNHNDAHANNLTDLMDSPPGCGTLTLEPQHLTEYCEIQYHLPCRTSRQSPSADAQNRNA